MPGQVPIFEKKNVVVTGGAGFIGSHLCERLLQEAKVICIDDLSSSGIRNIDHLLQYPDFEFIRYDVNQPLVLEDFEELDKFKIQYQGVQEIYHLACPTSPKNFEELKLQSLWANSRSMMNTLDLAVKYRAKYVFTSSSVIYGEPTMENYVFEEDYEGVVNHLSPRGSYNEGKRFAETSVETYRQIYGVDAKIARIFTTYGPRMRLRDGLLIPDFILDAIEGHDIVIYGDGENDTSLCFVSDVVDGLIRLMRTGPQIHIVNLGSEEVYRMDDVARQIIEMTRSKSNIVRSDPMEYVSRRGIPGLKRAKEQLGWLPLVRLQDGLRRTIDYAIANKEIVNIV